MRLSIPAGAVLVLAACGGGSPQAQVATDASPDATVDAAPGDAAPHDASAEAPQEASSPVDAGAGGTFCAATWGAQQNAFHGCCASGDITTNDYKFIDAIFTVVVKDCSDALSSAIRRGRIAFDASAAASCEAAIRTKIAGGECWPNIDTNQSGPPMFSSAACSGVVTGLQGSGAPCAVDFECKSGLTCVGWGSANDGACTAPAAAGGACEQAADAGSVLYIDWGLGSHPSCATGATCASPRCVAQVGAGGACGKDGDCTAGLTCHEGACGTTAPAAQGGACKGKVDCKEGLYCEPGDGGALPGTCQPREPGGGSCPSGGDACKGYCAVPDGGKTGVCTAVCGSG